MKFNKKFLSIFFIALLAVVLVACGGTTTTAAPTTAAPTTQAPTTAAPTTQAPTTVAPTTQAPTTVAPTTQAPTTTETPVDWATIEAALRAHYSETLDNDDFVATADLNLITTISGATIAWSSSNTTYLGHDGTVTQPAFSIGDQTVILTATLTVGTQDHEVMFFVTIDALAKTDAERATEALAAVMVFPFKEKWSSADSDSLEFLTTAQDADGASYTVVWVSSHPEYIAVDGTIVQPEGEDIVVTLTATITINEVEFSQTKAFTVSKMEEGTPVSTIAEAVAMGEDSYVKILGVTVIAKYASGDVFFTDGTDILYIYTPTFTSEVGGVYDITGVVDYYYNAPQLTGNDTHPLRAEASTEAAKAAPISVKASILDLIAEQTMPTPENLFQYKAYTVTAKIYVNAAWGNYSVFLVPSDYDFEAPLAVGATQPNGDSIMIYYKSDMSVLAAFHGQEVTIDIITQGWRSDKSVWYANFFGTAADVEINIADDAEAVATALAALTYPTTITEDATLDFPASLYGVTLSYESNNAAINIETGFVDAASQTVQQTVTLTVTANRGEVTVTKVFTIKVGELQVSTIAEALAGVKNDQFKVRATIIGGGYSTYYIQDATGAIGLYVPSGLRDFFSANTGQLIELVGTRDTYNGLNQLSTTTATLIEAGTLPAAVNVNGEADLLPFQSQLIELVAVEVTAKSTDSYGNISLTLKDLSNNALIAARWDSRYVIPAGLNTTLTGLVVGDIINIQAILGWYNAPQIAISAQTVITMTTDAEKLALDVANIPLTVLTTSNAVETTPLLGAYGSTIVWDLTTLVAAGGTYDNVTGQVVMPSIEVQNDYAVTATLTLGSEEAVVVNVTLTVVPMTAADKLAAAQAGLGVDEDCDGYDVVLLPLTGLYGTTVAWTVVSGDAVLAVDGTTLTFGNAATAFEVMLQATITLGEETPVTKDFTVTVTPAPIITDLSLIPAMADGTLVYVQGVVTGISFDGAFIQDANGVGFFLYRPASKAELAIGDEVVYKGSIGSYSNAKQLATGGILLEELSTGNALIYNTVTADDIHAFAMADAGSLFTFDGFVYKGISGTTMTLGYTLADEVTTGTVTVRYYTNWADLVLVASNYAIDDAIPAVNFVLYNFRDGLKQLDVLTVEFTDAEYIQWDADALPATLTLSDDYVIPTPANGSTYTVTAVSTELQANIDYTTTPGTLLVTQPAIGNPDLVGTVTIQVTLGAETPIDVVINVTVKAEVEAGTEPTIVTAAYPGGTTTNMTADNNAASIGLDPLVFNVVSTQRVINPLHIGLNTAGQIRLYADANGDGNILTISIDSAYTITGVEFVFGATVNSGLIKTGETIQFNGALTANSTVTYTDLTVSQFSIQNVTAGSTQIYILSIKITYIAN